MLRVHGDLIDVRVAVNDVQQQIGDDAVRAIRGDPTHDHLDDRFGYALTIGASRRGYVLVSDYFDGSRVDWLALALGFAALVVVMVGFSHVVDGSAAVVAGILVGILVSDRTRVERSRRGSGHSPS